MINKVYSSKKICVLSEKNRLFFQQIDKKVVKSYICHKLSRNKYSLLLKIVLDFVLLRLSDILDVCLCTYCTVSNS